MILQSLFFYLFSGILTASAFMVIASRNPVHSVLFLILCFFNAAALFLMLGAEFLAMILIVVYVGAVAVLFLFVVMMLDIDFVELRQGLLNYLPVGALVGGILLLELLIGIGGLAFMAPDAAQPAASSAAQTSNIVAIGHLLYTRHIFLFQLAGLILLVAMIGAIVLTLRRKEGVKRQDINAQVARQRDQAIELREVKTGEGVRE